MKRGARSVSKRNDIDELFVEGARGRVVGAIGEVVSGSCKLLGVTSGGKE